MKTYVVVEGHGEVRAVLNLVTRLHADLRLPPSVWSEPIRGKSLLDDDGIVRQAESVRSRPDASGLLVLADDDDGCPREDGPRLARALAAIHLPFPAAVVLAYREYESLFLPCIDRMAGKALVGDSGMERPGLRENARWSGDPEAKRDVKGWLSAHMSGGKTYKPRLDQLPLTRMVHFDSVRAAGLPWFGSLENGLRALARRDSVYPPIAAAM